VGLAPHIAHRKHEVSRDPAFDRQTPLLAGGCEQHWIDTARAIDRAGRGCCRRAWGSTSSRKRNVLLKRDKRESRSYNLLARVIRRIGIGPVSELVLALVLDLKPSPL